MERNRHIVQNYLQYLLLAVSWGILALFGGCSAPRDNPLDPQSDYYLPPVIEPVPPEFSVRVRSVHVSRRLISTDTYTVYAELRQQSGDAADSAWVWFKDDPWFGMTRPSGFWTKPYDATYFGTWDNAVGWPFSFAARVNGDTLLDGTARLARVIPGTPVIIEPVHNDTTSSFPVIEWNPFAVSYAIGYRVVVFNISDGITAYESELLPSNKTSLALTDSLPPRTYYCTVTVEDSFENSSRSKENWFIVPDASASAISEGKQIP